MDCPTCGGVLSADESCPACRSKAATTGRNIDAAVDAFEAADFQRALDLLDDELDSAEHRRDEVVVRRLLDVAQQMVRHLHKDEFDDLDEFVTDAERVLESLTSQLPGSVNGTLLVYEDDPSIPEPDQNDEEPESVLEPFETLNPYLRRLFAMQGYGVVPSTAVSLLREVSPDYEERLLAAIKAEHGQMRRGYLLATTKWLRWIRTFPTRQDDFWGYDQTFEYKGLTLMKGVITLASGDQFQAYRTRGKPFVEMLRVIQQAGFWAADHADDEMFEALTSRAEVVEDVAPATLAQPSLADDLDRIVALHERGLLTAEEFTAAKRKLLG